LPTCCIWVLRKSYKTMCKPTQLPLRTLHCRILPTRSDQDSDLVLHLCRSYKMKASHWTLPSPGRPCEHRTSKEVQHELSCIAISKLSTPEPLDSKFESGCQLVSHRSQAHGLAREAPTLLPSDMPCKLCLRLKGQTMSKCLFFEQHHAIVCLQCLSSSVQSMKGQH